MYDSELLCIAGALQDTFVTELVRVSVNNMMAMSRHSMNQNNSIRSHSVVVTYKISSQMDCNCWALSHDM
jgi:hypothetical protein